MTDTSKISPLPWAGFNNILLNSDGYVIARFEPEFAYEIQKIVEAVNNHERLKAENERLTARVELLEQLDREAATHVESVIALRTHFTGMPPYIGWRGLGLALTERLDELEARNALKET